MISIDACIIKNVCILRRTEYYGGLRGTVSALELSFFFYYDSFLL